MVYGRTAISYPLVTCVRVARKWPFRKPSQLRCRKARRGGRNRPMTNIVVLIKQVPDTWSERKLTDGDFTLDREAADAVLDEINERAVEEALLIKEKEGRRREHGHRAHRRPGARHRGDPQGAVDGRRQGRPPQRRRHARLRRDPDRVGAGRARWAPSRAPSWSSRATRPPTASAARFRRSSPNTWAFRSSPTCASCPSRAARSPASARPTTACSPSRHRCPPW